MNPLDLNAFGNDPWWVVLIKAVAVFVLLLLLTLFNIVYERKLVGKMQHRKGPTMNGPFGSLQSLADGMKLMFKEDFMPAQADKLVFNLAPFIVAIPAFTAWSVMPIAGEVKIPFSERTTMLQVTDLPMAVLFMLAIASIGIYGIVLAGWSSGSTYSLLGGLRSSAQMISYEIAMGLSLVTVFLHSHSMSTSQIVAQQAQTLVVGGFDTGIPGWFALISFPAFVIYAISMVGETNRAPFDLPEAEGELVGGFHTEYSGMRFAMFFLAEYINMATVSAIATTLFLGGWHAPWPLNHIPGIDAGYLGVVWFLLKVVFFISIFVWLRGTLPRFRYDQFMKLGWKWLIPIALVWVVLVALLQLSQDPEHRRVAWVSLGVIFGIALIAVFFTSGKDEDEEPVDDPDTAFDAWSGGYPVPPPSGVTLPELATVVGRQEPEARSGAATGVHDDDTTSEQEETN